MLATFMVARGFTVEVYLVQKCGVARFAAQVLHPACPGPLELTESYEVAWFGSCCFNSAPSFDNAFSAVRSTSSWRTWSRISRDRIGSETARERLIAPSRQLRIKVANEETTNFRGAFNGHKRVCRC